MRQWSSAVLPQWVYRVKSCPDPSNFSQWIDASKRLNCYHRLDSHDPLEQAMVYHCIPSSYLNETVEFCGTNVPISPGIMYISFENKKPQQKYVIFFYNQN